MTFSIVARSPDASAWGVAVASKFLAVGAAVPAAAAGAGALATQAYANLGYKQAGLRLLAEGRGAQEVVAALTGADEQREQRQLGVVDRTGTGASFTGSECHDWAGGRAGEGYAVQGNILTGPEVVEEMERAWRAGDGGGPGDSAVALAGRLLDVLAAGDRAGGDRRGRQSAALLVVAEGGGYGGLSDVAVDLRVDDAPAPVGELERLLDLHRLYFGRPDPQTLLPLRGALHEEVAAMLGELGYGSLADWAGVENYEMRLVDGAIDPLVLDRLRAATQGGRHR